MDKSLFNIKEDAIQLYNEIEEADGLLTPELETKLKISESELKTKATGYVGLIKTLKAQNKIRKEEQKRIDADIKRDENAINWLESNVEDAMNTFEIDEIKTELFKINFRKSKSVVVDDIDLIPEICKKTTVSITPDKKMIKEMIEGGDIIIGARIQENRNLQIK